MRHRKSGLKLGKTASHRQSMFKNMVTSLFKHDRIRTTDVKAKELRRWADHVITLAKRGDLHARRQVLTIIRDKNLVHELFEKASEKYSGRSSGYTRIVKIGRRAGDAAPISLIELIDSTPVRKDAPKSRENQSSAPAAPTVDAKTTSAPQESAEDTQLTGPESESKSANEPGTDEPSESTVEKTEDEKADK